MPRIELGGRLHLLALEPLVAGQDDLRQLTASPPSLSRRLAIAVDVLDDLRDRRQLAADVGAVRRSRMPSRRRYSPNCFESAMRAFVLRLAEHHSRTNSSRVPRQPGKQASTTQKNSLP
jgi:hypothetical protein